MRFHIFPAKFGQALVRKHHPLCEHLLRCLTTHYDNCLLLLHTNILSFLSERIYYAYFKIAFCLVH